MARPRILDLFCGAGGCSVGYHRAGFDVVGVDLNPMPNYPYEFHRADALTFPLDGFDVVHASPPCQGYTALAHLHGNEWPKLIGQIRDRLVGAGVPYVIENVVGAPLRPDLTLCGTMFDLPVLRHRLFETRGFFPWQPEHPPHRGRVRGWRHGQYHDGPYFAVYGDGGGKGTVAEWRTALGIDWTTDRRELAEAIPPAFTEYIGGLIHEVNGVSPVDYTNRAG